MEERENHEHHEHTDKEHKGDGPKLDLKTQRRILRFVNGARSPDQLALAPELVVDLHAEHRQRLQPDPHDIHEGLEHERARLLKTETAKRLIEQRDRLSPVFGFLNLEELLRDFEVFIRDLAALLSAATLGEWQGPFDIPAEFDRPIHAALLKTGDVLFYGGLPTGKNTFRYTPDPSGGLGTFTLVASVPGDSLFCAGQVFLSDGKLLVAGGGGDGTGARHNHSWLFDPDTDSWSRTGDLNEFRWYPTIINLGDTPGRMLVVGGLGGGSDIAQPEIYREDTGVCERVWGPGGVGDTSANHRFQQLYPGFNALPGGEVFYSPTGWHSGGCSGAADFPQALPSGYYKILSATPPFTATWTDVGAVDVIAEATLDRVKGMSVLLLQQTYPYVQVLVAGGGKDPESTTTFQMINLSTLSPEWGPALPLPDGLSRANVNLVLLPDGKVFLSGGRPLTGTPPDAGECWVYDPLIMTWSQMDRMANMRGYHSLAMLLPDARVLTAGNQCPPDRSIEIFSPPYLFAPDGSPAPRPVITNCPDHVHHGGHFCIETPYPCAVAKVVLVRPSALTHQTDSEQRVIPLTHSVSGPTALDVAAPDGWLPHALAPRGWYMVFLIDTAGVPSVAHFIHLT
ncbi:MAG TPA: galactose oxidase early set domain-containing protein [Pyrinomonadaceae bacterium]